MARICVLYPTRERAPGSIDKLGRELALLSGKHDVRVRIGLDDDDPTLLEALSALRGVEEGIRGEGIEGSSRRGAGGGGVRIEVVSGTSRDKVHATNRLAPDPDSYDVLIVHSDDMWVCAMPPTPGCAGPSPARGDVSPPTPGCAGPSPAREKIVPPTPGCAGPSPARGEGGRAEEGFGWDDVAVRALLERFPDTDGAVLCADGARIDLLTWPVLGSLFVRRLPWNGGEGIEGGRDRGIESEKSSGEGAPGGMPYDPRYTSVCCDDALTEVAKIRNRLHIGSPAVVTHRHPAWRTRAADALDARNGDGVTEMKDRGWLAAGRERGFDIERPVLSILTPTIPGREAALARLAGILRPVLERYSAIEWIVSAAPHQRDGGPTVGARRESLLRAAQGGWVWFIDDDDVVLPGAVGKVVGMLGRRAESPSHQSPAVIGFDCVYRDSKNGQREWMRFRHAWGMEWETFGGPRHRSETGATGELCGTRGIAHTNVVRRDLALAAGFAPLAWAEDKDFSDRLAHIGGAMGVGVRDGLRAAFLEGDVYVYETPRDPCRRWSEADERERERGSTGFQPVSQREGETG